MNILIQLRESIENKPDIERVRFLGIFCLHDCIYSKEKRIFIHYLMIIGYGGGGVQEEAFYKIEGSKVDIAKIYITTNCGGIDFEKVVGENNLGNHDLNLSRLDLEIQTKFLSELDHYLRYNEELCCFTYKPESKFIENGFYKATIKFPTTLLKNLNAIFWPFSIYFR